MLTFCIIALLFIIAYLLIYCAILRKQIRDMNLEHTMPIVLTGIPDHKSSDYANPDFQSKSELVNTKTEMLRIFEKTSYYTKVPGNEKHLLSINQNRDVNVSAAQSVDELDRFFFVALDCICILDLNGKFERINKQWELLFGYPENQFPGTLLFDYLNENDIIATKEFIVGLHSHTEVATFINRFRCFDHTYKWLEWRLLRAGKQIYAAARDVTDRKRDEDTLRDLVEVTVRTPTEGFFESISEWLRIWLNADLCFVCEFNQNAAVRIVAVSGSSGVSLMIDYTDYEPIFDLTVSNGFCHYVDNIDAICPKSALIQNLHARGYIGISLYDKNGEVKGIICIFSKSVLPLPSMSNEVFQLIAVRASGELEYFQSEARYSSILNTAMEGFALLDKEGRFIDVNEAYCRLIGYDKVQLTKKTITEIDIADNRSEKFSFPEKLQTKIHDRFETQHRRADGKPIDLEISINLLTTGSARYVLFLRDITERKKTEAAIGDITERFTLATRAANMGIWDWDVEQNTLVWNDQMFQLYGREKEEYTSLEVWKDSLHPEDADRTLIEVDFALKGIKEFDSEFRIILPDKSIKHVRVMSKVHRDKNGKALRLIGTNWDISAEKETQKEFRNAIDEADRANRSKSEFVANMSHEIRTPLNAVIGFSELLETLSTDDKQKHYINSIITAGRSLLRIINDILDMSKIESGMMKVQFAPVELQPIFDEIQAIFKPKIEEKGLKFILSIDTEIPKVLHLDEIRLRQVLLNLVGNAVKFTDSGYIKVSVQIMGTLDTRESVTDLSFQVEDTGIGIPKDEQSFIFEPFRQQSGQNSAKYGGTGLGLSISRKLTELMNGELSVRSTPGKGALFTLQLFKVKFLPVQKTTQKRIQPNTADAVIFSNATVLVADDIESNRVVIREHLINAGLEVIEVDNGIDASRIALEKKPQVIIMDIRMPKLSGIDAMKQIRTNESTKDIPIIALSAATNVNEIEGEDECELSFSEYLCKPIDREHLINVLTKFIPLQIKKPSRRQRCEKISLSKELKELFNNRFLDKLNNFSGAIRTKSLRSLIVELRQFSKENDSGEIDSIASKLDKAVEAFDIEKINSSLKTLTELCT